MAFRESPRFPEAVSLGAMGGPGFLTDVVEVESGAEQRNQLWSAPRARYDVGHGVKNDTDFAALLSFFRATAVGRTHGFRFKDWTDYTCVVAAGRLGTGAVGTGLATYQLYKRYSSGSQTEDRLISKPVSGSATIYRNAAPATAGVSAGNYALDTTTGIVTFVADASANIASHTPGASHVFTTATDIGLIVGKKVYISGVTGTGAATLNGIAHSITNKSGAGPYTWTLSTVTTGLTTSGGTSFAFPQASDALTWAGEFDVPCRFDTDRMDARADEYGATSWPSIPLVELRL